MCVKYLEWRSSHFAQAAVLALAAASVAGCSDVSRYGEGNSYQPGTANQQAYLGNPQYAPPRPYHADTTGSIQSHSEEPWYGRPWQSPQAAPPAFQSQPVPQRTYPQQSYQPQPIPAPPGYQTQPLPPVASAPVKPVAMAKQPAQPEMVLRPGPSAASPQKVAALQPIPPAQPVPRVQPVQQVQPIPQAPRPLAARPLTAPLATGSTGQASSSPVPHPVQAEQQPMPASPPVAQASRADQRQLASNWSPVGGTYIPLKPGETILTLSQRYGVPVAAIMNANNFADATRVAPGQQVLIPTYVYNGGQTPAAPHVAAQPIPVEPAPPKGGEHLVKYGESIESISRMYGIPRDRLEAANHLRGDSVLKPGQKLAIPLIAGRHVAEAKPVVPVQAVKPAQAVAVAPAPPQPVKVAEQKTGAAPAASETGVFVAQEPKPTVDAPRSDAAKAPMFRWPVRGRVIEAFGASANGSRNDGINLAVPEGTSVKAAEDGEVIYSGNELKGYGNVVLVKHANGWVTVYAHASELLVSKGDTVSRGQIIARAGATGSVTQPQLHFELRQGQKPVDPKSYLTN